MPTEKFPPRAHPSQCASATQPGTNFAITPTTTSLHSANIEEQRDARSPVERRESAIFAQSAGTRERCRKILSTVHPSRTRRLQMQFGLRTTELSVWIGTVPVVKKLGRSPCESGGTCYFALGTGLPDVAVRGIRVSEGVKQFGSS